MVSSDKPINGLAKIMIGSWKRSHAVYTITIFHEILKTTDVLEITFLNSLNEDLKKTVLTMQHGNIGGIHRFAYAFGRTPEEPKLSLWIYQFYTRHWAGVVTKPADFEFSALDNDRALA
jgi:hypothetical protein